MPYYSLSEHMKETYGEKVYKLAVDGGFTCPNRDGTLDTRGCIFCSASGSGDHASDRSLDIREQIRQAKALIRSKTAANRFVVYFQAFTNTYGDVADLKRLYTSALVDDSIVGISIATRPDCLSDEIINMLKELNRSTDITVELGLQTIHAGTATFIRRHYPLDVYDNCVDRLHEAGLPVVTHVILGLPGETKGDMLSTVRYAASRPIQGIKLQLLHVLRDTDLHEYYRKQPFHILTEDEYVDIVIECLENIPSDVVIHRLTGDGPRDLLVAPLWSRNKRHVLNSIFRTMKLRNSYQGRQLKEQLHD